MVRRRKKKKSPARPIAESRAAPELPRAGRRRTLAVWLLPLLVAGAIAVAFLRPTTFTPQRLNVIIVTADTLRADKLGTYGNAALETPHIDQMANEGIVFEQAVTAAPVTLPSHASIFTGSYPPSHGVRDNGGAALSSDRTTLAEVLRSEGYATGAFIGAFVLSSRWGLDQGFDQYDDDIDTGDSRNLGGSDAQRRGDAVLADAFRWMDSVKGRAFFSWIHLFDPHMPYDPPEPFRSRHDDPYDGEIAYVDSLVGEILEWVDANELGESTLIAFVGDHGESLGEHDELTHGFFVYDATMRVPLVVRTPYRELESRRVSSLVRTIDLMPTVLELVGVETPDGVQGRSLLRLARGRPPGENPPAYGESLFPSHYGWSPLRSLRDEEFLFVDAPRPELYDLRADPTQQTNLAPAHAATAESYQERLRGVESEMGGFDAAPSPSATLDPETASKLTALGYVGAGSFRPVDSSSASDPKDKIDLFNRIREAATAADAGRLDDAIMLLGPVLHEDPGILEARNMLAGYLARRGDLPAAAAAYQEALSQEPDYAPAILGLASAQFEMGRRQDAETTLARMLALEPGNPPGSFLLARIYIDSGRFREALALLENVETVDDAERAHALTLAAESRLGVGQIEEAEAAIDEALELGRRIPGIHHQLAVIREKRGDGEGAAEAYAKELEIAPESYRAHFDFAKLLGQNGREEEMLAHLERSIEVNPRFAIGHLYLANALLERGTLERAMELARKGIQLGPEPSIAPLGHFILADVYQRMGRREDAAREMAIAQRLHKESGIP